MICYNCGCNLSEHDFCTNCGADVSRYKKIMFISNRFYNEGLEKAKVRDLSGAINALRQCLKFNKNNIEARNLLGLVYFETGEVVAALSEWVISQNMRPKKNIANDYIEMIQSNPTKLDNINQTIKKYNQALTYCSQDSQDLAIIQLKKVLSLNGKFIRARQLLALLYIYNEQWEEAKRELIKCAQIDTGNTTTMRYRKEVDMMLSPVEGSKTPKKKKKEEVLTYTSGNELIIQPTNAQGGHGLSIVLNISLGIVIGLIAAWFLVMPARVKNASVEAEEKVKLINEQLNEKTADIEELEAEVEKSKGDYLTLKEELDNYETSDASRNSLYSLLQAVNVYLTDSENILGISQYLDEVNVEDLGEDSAEAPVAMYNTLMDKIGPQMAGSFYDEGYNAYNEGNYEVAIENLAKAYHYDPTNGDALYYLAQSYNSSGNDKEAISTYQKVIDEFPDSQIAAKSQTYIEKLSDASN